MQKIFKINFNKFASKFIIPYENKYGLDSMNTIFKKYIPKNQILVRKIPQKELKFIAKLECNYSNSNTE